MLLKKFIFLSCLFLAACQPQLFSQKISLPDKQNITEGQDPTDHDPILNSIVRLDTYIAGRLHTCTGSVLSARLVLTAAHCVVNKEAQRETVMDPQKIIVNGNLAWGQKIIVHPNYGRILNSFGYDIALIYLDRPLPDTYQAVQFADYADFANKNVKVAGYGRQSDFILSRLGDLQIGEMFFDTQLSSFEHSNPKIITNQIFSRTYQFDQEHAENLSQICTGDSGGPVYILKNTQVFLLGVVSAFDTTYGDYCSRISLVDSVIYNKAFIANAFETLSGSKPSADSNLFDYTPAILDPAQPDYEGPLVQTQLHELDFEGQPVEFQSARLVLIESDKTFLDKQGIKDLKKINMKFILQLSTEKEFTCEGSFNKTLGSYPMKDKFKNFAETELYILAVYKWIQENQVQTVLYEAQATFTDKEVEIVVTDHQGVHKSRLPFTDCTQIH